MLMLGACGEAAAPEGSIAVKITVEPTVADPLDTLTINVVATPSGIALVQAIDLGVSGFATFTRTVEFAGTGEKTLRQLVPIGLGPVDGTPITITATARGTADAEATPVVVPVVDSQPPLVELVEVQPRPAFDPPDTLTVRYVATDNGAVTRVFASWSGAASGADTLEVDATRHVQGMVLVGIPDVSRPVDLIIRIVARDGTGIDGVLIDTIPLVDLTAPGLTQTGAGVPDPAVYLSAGHVAVMGGDTLVFRGDGLDNVQVAAVGYRLAGAWSESDSMAGGSRYVAFVKPRVVPDSVVGSFTASFFAIDHAGNRTTVSSDLTFHVVQPRVDEVAVGVYQGVWPLIADAAYDPVRERIYLSQAEDRRIAIFDAVTAQSAGTIALSGKPGGIDVTASGDSIIVAVPDTGSLGVVDLTSASPTINIIGLVGGRATTVRVTASNVAVVPTGGPASIVTYDLAAGTEHAHPDVLSDPVAWSFVHLARSGDRQRVVVLEDGRCCQLRAWMFDDRTSTFGPATPTVPLSFLPTPLSSGRDGSRLLIGTTVFNANLDSVTTPIARNSAVLTALAVDGISMFVTQPYGFYRVNVSDGTVLDAVRLPFTPEGLLVTPDGTRVILYGEFRIAVVRL